MAPIAAVDEKMVDLHSAWARVKEPNFNDLPKRAHLRPSEIAKWLDLHVSTIYDFLQFDRLGHLRLETSNSRRPTIRIQRDVFISWYLEHHRELDGGE